MFELSTCVTKVIMMMVCVCVCALQGAYKENLEFNLKCAKHRKLSLLSLYYQFNFQEMANQLDEEMTETLNVVKRGRERRGSPLVRSQMETDT